MQWLKHVNPISATATSFSHLSTVKKPPPEAAVRPSKFDHFCSTSAKVSSAFLKAAIIFVGSVQTWTYCNLCSPLSWAPTATIKRAVKSKSTLFPSFSPMSNLPKTTRSVAGELAAWMWNSWCAREAVAGWLFSREAAISVV